MVTGNAPVLAVASKVLLPATIEGICRQPFNIFGWSILDRWAYNTPDKLRALEKQGIILLLNRLLEQQRCEQAVLTAPGLAHLSNHEKLQLHEVDSELRHP